MPWVTNAHGLIEGHEPDNLLAYDNEPQFCRDFTKEEYEFLYQMLNPRLHRDEQFSDVRAWMYNPYLAGVIALAGFDPDKIKEAIRILPNRAPRIGYAFVKKMQVLVQQVADEDLPLLMGVKDPNDDEHVLKIILEWRLRCQKQ
jgi:hypothetical protein